MRTLQSEPSGRVFAISEFAFDLHTSTLMQIARPTLRVCSSRSRDALAPVLYSLLPFSSQRPLVTSEKPGVSKFVMPDKSDVCSVTIRNVDLKEAAIKMWSAPY